MVKFSESNPPYQDWHRWNELCPSGRYQTVQPASLYGLLPERLLEKVHSAVVMASGTGATSVVVANIARVDKEDIDQEPYICVFDHPNERATGGFVHHGDWPGRTQPCERWFLEQVAQSGIPRHLPIRMADLPSASGDLHDLKESSHMDAFWRSLRLKEKAERSTVSRRG